jgi:hypothetical protein
MARLTPRKDRTGTAGRVLGDKPSSAKGVHSDVISISQSRHIDRLLDRIKRDGDDLVARADRLLKRVS